MSITKAEIFTQVLQRMNVIGIEITDIDEELRNTLYDISTRDDFLKASGTLTTVDGTPSYDEPSLYKSWNELFIADGHHLELIPYERFRFNVADTSSPTPGEPREFAYYDGKFYLFPVPDAVYSVTVEYNSYHANSVTSIEFSEQFREAILNGVLWRLFAGQTILEMMTKARQESVVLQIGAMQTVFERQYENAIEARRRTLHRKSIRVQYSDI